MATRRFSLPTQWEDWVNLLLGIWLCASPWVLQFAGDMAPTQNAFVVGALLIAAETVELMVFRNWEEWVNVALGAWLVISPWAWGVTAFVPAANFVVVGLLVLALACYEMWEVRRHSTRAA